MDASEKRTIKILQKAGCERVGYNAYRWPGAGLTFMVVCDSIRVVLHDIAPVPCPDCGEPAVKLGPSATYQRVISCEHCGSLYILPWAFAEHIETTIRFSAEEIEGK